MHEIDLAWALASAAHDRLEEAERIATYVEVGGGDAGAAIRRLTSVVVTQRIRVTPEIADALRAWWAFRDSVEAAGDVVVALSLQRDDVSTSASLTLSYLAVRQQLRSPKTPAGKDRR